ncbi:hypothetical protein C0995_009677 [Termitomyces sp. Mi166|nr:hypothetical protein C0995_009677 [Termitomyces sp. Mi166\
MVESRGTHKLVLSSGDGDVSLWRFIKYARFLVLATSLTSGKSHLHNSTSGIKFTVIGFSGSKGFAMLFDITSTITMCIYLKRNSSNVTTGTRRVVRFLVFFFLQRGALVTIVQTMLFVVNWAFNQEMYWLTPHLLVTRLYVNTFFAMYAELPGIR